MNDTLHATSAPIPYPQSFQEPWYDRRLNQTPSNQGHRAEDSHALCPALLLKFFYQSLSTSLLDNTHMTPNQTCQGSKLDTGTFSTATAFAAFCYTAGQTNADVTVYRKCAVTGVQCVWQWTDEHSMVLSHMTRRSTRSTKHIMPSCTLVGRFCIQQHQPRIPCSRCLLNL